jgi:hypothetical protein
MVFWWLTASNCLLLKTNIKRSVFPGVFLLLYSMKFSVLLIIAWLCVLPAEAQFRKVNKTPDTENHFLMNGIIYNYDIVKDQEMPASHVQIVIYQNKELYVAFFGGADGAYSFYLPIGYEYEVWFGGSAYVNKKLAVDATQMPEEKKPRSVVLDVSLFHAVEGVDFSMLNDPYARIFYDPETDAARTDDAFFKKQKVELDRAIKKAKKQLQTVKD